MKAVRLVELCGKVAVLDREADRGDAAGSSYLGDSAQELSADALASAIRAGPDAQLGMLSAKNP